MEHFDPQRRDFSPYGLSCVRWKPTRMDRPDHHNEIEINILYTGELHYQHQGRELVLRQGQVALFWAMLPHRIVDFSPETNYHVITVPLPAFLLAQLPAPFVQALLGGKVWIDELKNKGLFEQAQAERWESDLKTDNKGLRAVVHKELTAWLHRFAYNTLGLHSVQPDLGSASLNRVEQMAAFVASHYQQDIKATVVGAEVGLHPNYAMGLFKQGLGTTLNQYLTRLRLAHAHWLLLCTDRKVLDIAHESGFPSLSRFNAAFKAQFGRSPREMRKERTGA